MTLFDFFPGSDWGWIRLRTYPKKTRRKTILSFIWRDRFSFGNPMSLCRIDFCHSTTPNGLSISRYTIKQMTASTSSPSTTTTTTTTTTTSAHCYQFWCPSYFSESKLLHVTASTVIAFNGVFDNTGCRSWCRDTPPVHGPSPRNLGNCFDQACCRHDTVAAYLCRCTCFHDANGFRCEYRQVGPAKPNTLWTKMPLYCWLLTQHIDSSFPRRCCARDPSARKIFKTQC